MLWSELLCAAQQYKNIGLVASNHGNLYVTPPTLVLGRYGLPHAEVNGTE